MKTRMLRTIGTTALLSAFVAGSASSATLTPIDATATSFFLSGGSNLPATNLINGSNFTDTGDPLTSTHTFTNSALGTWHTASLPSGNTAAGVIDDQAVTFDLGGAYALDAAYVWQFGQRNNVGPGRGVDEFEILLSTDGGANFASAGVFNLGILSITDTFVPVEVINFAPTAGVTHVMFDINSNHAGASSGYTGLSEVRFNAIPEPASLSVGLVGLAALVARRRRR